MFQVFQLRMCIWAYESLGGRCIQTGMQKNCKRKERTRDLLHRKHHYNGVNFFLKSFSYFQATFFNEKPVFFSLQNMYREEKEEGRVQRYESKQNLLLFNEKIVNRQTCGWPGWSFSYFYSAGKYRIRDRFECKHGTG